MHISTRRALFASAITGATLVVASPAQAACTVTPAATPVAGTVVCATTTTTDTTYAGVSPAVDRNYNVDTSTTAFTGTVSTGVIVDGYGLAFTNTVGGTNALNVVNNGTVQVNAGLAATAGGTGALSISAVGATPINYSGTGSITNLGTSGNGLEIGTTGTGNITANVGGNVTSALSGGGISGIGILAINAGTGGNIAVTTATGTTIRADLAGIIAINNGTHAGTVSVTNNATIGSLTGALNTLEAGVIAGSNGTGAVTVINNGAIGSATDRVQTIGVGGVIANPASAAALTVSGTGAVFSAGEGVSALNAGTGTTTVNYSGAINTTAGEGIYAESTTGALSVTSGAITAVGGNGIETYSTTGNQTINVGGNVVGDPDGIHAVSDSGNITVNVTGGNVTGTSDDAVEIETAGTGTVNVSATRTLSGDYGVYASGTGALTVNNSGTITGTTNAILTTSANATTVNNNAGGTINGTFDLSDAADTINNRGTINDLAGSFFYAGNDVVNNLAGGVINLDGAVDFGTGTDTFANTGGTINITANSTLVGLETFSTTGRINFSAGTTLTGPAVAFVNGPGSFIDTAGDATIAGFTSMSNSGTIDLAAGTFTVPAGVFTNTASGIVIADEGATTITGQTSFVNAGVIDLLDGAVNDTLTINSAYSGTGRLQIDVSGTTADLLVINGNVTGQTVVDVNTVGLGVFDPDGIQFVDVTGAFTSAPGSFVIGEEVSNPLINFDVERRGQDFFLVTLLDPDNAFVPLAATGLIREMWYQSADEVFANTLVPSDKVGLSVWGNVYGGQRQTGETNSQTVNGVQYDADNNIEIDRLGVQAGVGYGFGMARIGLTGGYEQAAGEGDGEFDASGFNIGLYGQYGGLTGFHAEALFKHDSYDVEFDGLFDGNDVDGDSTGFDIAGGYRFAVGIVPSLDVHAGLSHVWSDLDDVEAYGFGYEFDKLTSTRGRLGVRGNFGGVYNPYLGATIYREFDGDGDVTINQGAFASDLNSTGKGTWARLEGGIGGTGGTYGLNLAGWVDVGDTRGVGLRAGFRF